MSTNTSEDGPIQLPHAVHMDLARLGSTVALKRVELENALLREELAIRRVLDAFGLSGQKVRLDLDSGMIHLVRVAEVE